MSNDIRGVSDALAQRVSEVAAKGNKPAQLETSRSGDAGANPVSVGTDAP